MLILAQVSGVSDKVIAKAILLSDKVVYNKDGTYTVPGSTESHIVTLDPDKCGCKYKGLCSHILAARFYKEKEESNHATINFG